MLALTLQSAGLRAVSVCEMPPIEFQMSWMTWVWPPWLPLIAENVYGPQDPSLDDVTQAGPVPCPGGVDDGGVDGGLDGELGLVLGLELGFVVGVGWAPAAGPDCALHWISDEPLEHFGALVDTWVSRPPARQA
jgi:hypothetical protein